MVSQQECPACGATDKADRRKVWITDQVMIGVGTTRVRVVCIHAWHNPAAEVQPDSSIIGTESR